MYIKPIIITFSKDDISNMMLAKASCSGGQYCSKGATYCGVGSNHSSNCGSSKNYCSGGSYTG